MRQPPPPDVLRKVGKLVRLPVEVRQSQFAVSVTRLTSLKSLCQNAEVAGRFVSCLARRTLGRVRRGRTRAERLPPETARAHHRLMRQALAAMAAWMHGTTEARRRRLGHLHAQLRAEQDEYQRIKWGPVRLIRDADLLLFEYALDCLLEPHAAGHWAYQTARHYAERYDPRHGTGLISESAPLLQDIADFWTQELGLDREASTGPPRTKRATGEKPSRGPGKGLGNQKKVRFTPRQRQFLAFIHLYRKLHGQGPAELEMVKFFRVSPPSVHGMVVRLEELGLVTRQPGVARSVRVAIPEDQIPELETAEGLPG